MTVEDMRSSCVRMWWLKQTQGQLGMGSEGRTAVFVFRV